MAKNELNKLAKCGGLIFRGNYEKLFNNGCIVVLPAGEHRIG